MENLPSDDDLHDFIKLAELNLQKEIKDAKMKRNSQLVVISGSSESSKKSASGSQTLSSIENSMGGIHLSVESSFSGSFLRIEDIEMPSSFNASVTGYEEVLCISEDSVSDCSEQNSKPKETKDEILKASSSNLDASNSGPIIFSEAQKVIEALEKKDESISPNIRMSILDLENLNDSFLYGTPNAKLLTKGASQYYKKFPQISTPKEEKENEFDINDIESAECGLNVELNDTFKEEFNRLIKDTSFTMVCEEAKPRTNFLEAFNQEMDKIVNAGTLTLKSRDEEPLSKSDGTFVQPSNGGGVDGTFAIETEEGKPKLKLNVTFEKESQKADGTFALELKDKNCPDTNDTFVKELKQMTKENNLSVPDSCPNQTITLKPNEMEKDGTFFLNKEDPDDTDKEVKEKPAVNTTFDSVQPDGKEKKKKFNSTFDAETEMDEENLNRTIEVVGNGSFIIEGKTTNLMDMESIDLKTVLYSTPVKGSHSNIHSTPISNCKMRRNSIHNTPTSRFKETPQNPKNAIKSSLLKRLSMVGIQSKNILLSGEASEKLSDTEHQGSKDSDSSKMDLPQSKAILAKEGMIIRLKKNTNGVSTNGPMKAVPLPFVAESLGQGSIGEVVKSRAASTPILPGRLKSLQKESQYDSSGNEGKEGKAPSLSSFGSVSSIDDKCSNGLDFAIESGMSTPEVFRHRDKTDGPAITSTPAMPFNIKFGSDLGFGSAPTPIVAPSSKQESRPCKVSKSSFNAQNLCFSQSSNKGVNTNKDDRKTASPGPDRKEIPKTEECTFDNCKRSTKVLEQVGTKKVDSTVPVETKKINTTTIEVEAKKVDTTVPAKTKKVNTTVEVEGKKVNTTIEVEAKKVNTTIEVEAKKVNTNVEVEAKKVNTTIEVEAKKVNTTLPVDAMKVDTIVEDEAKMTDTTILVEAKKVNTTVEVEAKKVDTTLPVEIKKVNTTIEVKAKKVDTPVPAKTKKDNTNIEVEAKKVNTVPVEAKKVNSTVPVDTTVEVKSENDDTTVMHDQKSSFKKDGNSKTNQELANSKSVPSRRAAASLSFTKGNSKNTKGDPTKPSESETKKKNSLLKLNNPPQSTQRKAIQSVTTGNTRNAGLRQPAIADKKNEPKNNILAPRNNPITVNKPRSVLKPVNMGKNPLVKRRESMKPAPTLKPKLPLNNQIPTANRIKPPLTNERNTNSDPKSTLAQSLDSQKANALKIDPLPVNKENLKSQTNVKRLSKMVSGIRPPSIRTGIPVPKGSSLK